MLWKFRVVILILFVVVPGFAQKNQLGINVGGYFPVNAVDGATPSFVLSESYALRLVGTPAASFYLELPAFTLFNSTTAIVGNSHQHVSYAAMFFTPGLLVKIAPESRISPYIVGGGGVAYFSMFFSGKNSTTTGVFDAGGGAEVKLAPFLSARGEVRDFYSGNPNIQANFTNRQHQVIGSVGLVFRF